MTRASYIVLFAVLFSAPIAAVAQHSAAGSTIYGTSADARISAVDETVARQWNEVLLEAIRGDFARPTVHARNLFHTSIALYDAFALYHEADQPVFVGNVWRGFECPLDTSLLVIPADPELQALAVEETMSYAAYRLLTHRFLSSPGSADALASFSALMLELGYDAAYQSQNISEGPAALGNYIGAQLIQFGLQDGSNEQMDFANQDYQPINPDLELADPGNPNLIDPNAWQPLAIPIFVDQSGNVLSETPPFQGAEWGYVASFALEDSSLSMLECWCIVYLSM